MAFAVNDQVLRMNRSPATTTTMGQPPNIGTITSIAGAPVFDVLWNDGHIETSVPGASLYGLNLPDPAEVTRLAGQVVRSQPGGPDTLSAAASFDAVVALLYRRNDGGTVVTVDTFALIVVIETGLWQEVVSTTLQPVQR